MRSLRSALLTLTQLDSFIRTTSNKICSLAWPASAMLYIFNCFWDSECSFGPFNRNCRAAYIWMQRGCTDVDLSSQSVLLLGCGRNCRLSYPNKGWHFRRVDPLSSVYSSIPTTALTLKSPRKFHSNFKFLPVIIFKINIRGWLVNLIEFDTILLHCSIDRSVCKLPQHNH